MKKIPLASKKFPGRFARVDDRDFKRLSKLKWHVVQWKNRNTFYAVHYKCIYMHKLVLPVKAERVVDHMNRDGLDNRRRNLREATKGQNVINRPVSRNNTTGYKGVVRRTPPRKGYQAFIQARFEGDTKKRRRCLYTGPDPKAAARAYNAAALKQYGEFAVLNDV